MLFSQEAPNTTAAHAAKIGMCVLKGTCRHNACYVQSQSCATARGACCLLLLLLAAAVAAPSKLDKPQQVLEVIQVFLFVS